MTGEEVKAMRLECRLTQKEWAMAVGVSTNTVWRWERGLNVPSLPTQREIHRIFSLNRPKGKRSNK